MEYIHVALNNALCMDQILYRLSGVEYLKLSACENEYAIKFFIFVSINNMYLKNDLCIHVSKSYKATISFIFVTSLYLSSDSSLFISRKGILY